MLSSRKQRNAHYAADERAPVIGDEPGNGRNRVVKRGMGRGEERTENEGRKSKNQTLGKRLGNGTPRSGRWFRDVIFSRIELLIAKVQHQNAGYVGALYIFRFGCGNKKTIRSAGTVDPPTNGSRAR